MVTVEVTASCEHCNDQEKHQIPISQLHNRWWKPKEWTWISAEVGPVATQPGRVPVAVLVCSKCREALQVDRQKHAGVSMGVKT